MLKTTYVIGIFIGFAALVLIVSSAYHGAVKQSEVHQSKKAAIHRPRPTAHATQGPRHAGAEDVPHFDGLIHLARDPKHVPWLPGTTSRREGVIKPADQDPLPWSVISPANPRAMRVFNVLTEAECASLVAYAKTQLQRSQVIAQTYDGKSEVNNVRTSSGMFMSSQEQRDNPVNKKLHARALAVIGLGEDSWIEATQILRYEAGQFYRPHTDYFDDSDKPNMNRGGQRLMTMLTWLNNVSGGGETSFPQAAAGPIKAKPVVGQAVLFYDVNEQAVADPHSMHGGDPPTAGEKWVAVLWCHGRPFY